MHTRQWSARARLRSGVSISDLDFDGVRHAAWALESYGTFKQLKEAGVIARPPETIPELLRIHLQAASL